MIGTKRTSVRGRINEENVTMPIVRFMSSTAGRALRGVAGIALIAWGFTLHSTAGTALMIVGLLPLAAGMFDLCVLGPVFGVPLRGEDVRRLPNA